MTFEKEASEVVSWMSQYLKEAENYPVKAQVKPGEIFNQLPDNPPDHEETFEVILNDFEKIIMPGMTHWHSPNFFAYFPANKSEPSILAEMITATLGAQCMSWITSPAAAELEEQMMIWLRDMIGLPNNFEGVIQDTASTATLCALLTAREKATNFEVNQEGLYQQKKMIVYASSQIHSSIDKAVKIAGLGLNNLRKIAVDDELAMIPSAFEAQILEDIEAGYQPLCVVTAYGTTSSTAVDPIQAIDTIAKKYGIWHHVDAAYAGTALICPEFRALASGYENADSVVFNPHKWMFTNFDCSAYFVKDKEALVRTFAENPEYLKTSEDHQVHNYRDWGIQLGRRFRALKLWFVIRHFGVEGIRKKLRHHITLTKWMKSAIDDHPNFNLLTPVKFNLLCFYYKPDYLEDKTAINAFNEKLLNRLNQTGKLFVTHTVIKGYYTIRMVIGNTDVEKRHVENAWELIKSTAENLKAH